HGHRADHGGQSTLALEKVERQSGLRPLHCDEPARLREGHIRSTKLRAAKAKVGGVPVRKRNVCHLHAIWRYYRNSAAHERGEADVALRVNRERVAQAVI